MALSEQDRREIELAITDGAFKAFSKAVEAHIEGCPHGKNLGLFKARLVGIVIGVSAVCSLVTGSLVYAFNWFKLLGR